MRSAAVRDITGGSSAVLPPVTEEGADPMEPQQQPQIYVTDDDIREAVVQTTKAMVLSVTLAKASKQFKSAGNVASQVQHGPIRV